MINQTTVPTITIKAIVRYLILIRPKFFISVPPYLNLFRKKRCPGMATYHDIPGHLLYDSRLWIVQYYTRIVRDSLGTVKH